MLLLFHFSCASCHSSCDTCNGSAESQCITCRSGRFAFDGKCLNNCPDGYYADKKRQECVACPTGCATCSSNGFCLTCRENWTRNKKSKCIITGSENCDECKYNIYTIYINTRNESFKKIYKVSECRYNIGWLHRNSIFTQKYL